MGVQHPGPKQPPKRHIHAAPMLLGPDGDRVGHIWRLRVAMTACDAACPSQSLTRALPDGNGTQSRTFSPFALSNIFERRKLTSLRGSQTRLLPWSPASPVGKQEKP